MMPNRRAEIERRAYLLWEREGRPQDKALDHWLRAEAAVDAQGKSDTAGAAEPKPPTAKAKRLGKRKGGTPR